MKKGDDILISKVFVLYEGKGDDHSMMYPFMTLDDGTEIVHSETLPDNRVKVYIEKPDEKDCFHHAVCYLPGYTWEDVDGFSADEVEKYQKILESTAHLIIEFAGSGGLENAAGF